MYDAKSLAYRNEGHTLAQSRKKSYRKKEILIDIPYSADSEKSIPQN